MALAAERPQGYLVLTAIESSGRSKDDVYVWGGSEVDSFGAYVKGGPSQLWGPCNRAGGLGCGNRTVIYCFVGYATPV